MWHRSHPADGMLAAESLFLLYQVYKGVHRMRWLNSKPPVYVLLAFHLSNMLNKQPQCWGNIIDNVINDFMAACMLSHYPVSPDLLVEWHSTWYAINVSSPLPHMLPFLFVSPEFRLHRKKKEVAHTVCLATAIVMLQLCQVKMRCLWYLSIRGLKYVNALAMQNALQTQLEGQTQISSLVFLEM